MSHYREPIKHTCPDIDKLVKSIYAIYKSIKGYENFDNLEDLKSVINEIESELWGSEDLLEELRESNQKLREWGNKEANEVDRLIDEISKIYDLNAQEQNKTNEILKR